MYIYNYTISDPCPFEQWAEGTDSELYDVAVASLLMELLGDDAGCHGKLPGAPNDGPLPSFNGDSHHLKCGPTKPASYKYSWTLQVLGT